VIAATGLSNIQRLQFFQFELFVSLTSRKGDITLRAQITTRVKPGVPSLR
jgi:hypothetical protein